VLDAGCAGGCRGGVRGGFVAGRRRDFVELAQSRRSFADPLTRRFQQWLSQRKMAALSRKQWSRFAAADFREQLCRGGAGIANSVCGNVQCCRLYLTYRQGLSQGAFQQAAIAAAAVGARVRRIYLLATAVGLATLAGGGWRPSVYCISLVALALASRELGWRCERCRSRIRFGMEIPANVNIDELRAKALET